MCSCADEIFPEAFILVVWVGANVFLEEAHISTAVLI